MSAFSKLIKLLIEVGFERSDFSYMSGSYRLSTESPSVTVYLGCSSSITIIVEQPNRYKVCFFYTYTLRIKDLIMSFKELEEMLLISIIRNSFLTEEENTKAVNEFLEMFL